jgi:tetratricopeptide (TPR) repeat protein
VGATATAWAPGDRYADAAAFADALAQAAAAGRPAAAGRRRRAALAAAGTAAALAAAALAWRAAGPARAPLDPARVTVYPLVVSGAGPRAAGEDAATAIGSALDRAGPLRSIDGWRLLDGRARADARALTPEAAGALARAKGCAHYVTGRLVYRGDSADVFLELVDAAGDSVVARGRAGGLARESWRVGLRAVTPLLPALIPGGDARDAAAGWADRDPGAVASFLAGEAAFRRARPAAALVEYRAAVARDSGFGPAALRGAQAATWMHRDAEAAALIRAALRHPLAPRDAHFARGYAAYLAGRADSAAAELRRALRLDPDMVAAWVQLGEVHTHLLPASAGGDGDSLAADAFERARRLDGGAAHAFHLVEIYARRGDTARAGPLARAFLAARPDAGLAEQVRAADACVRRGPGGVDWPAAVARDPLAVLSAAKTLAGGGAQLACAEAAYAAVLAGDTAAGAASEERRWRALTGLQAALLARGRIDEARARVEAGVRSGLGGANLFLLGSVVAPGYAAPAAAVAAADARACGAGYERCPYPIRLWHLGVWAAHAGRVDVAEAVGRRLSARARATGEPSNARLAHSIAAQAALARGDTLAAVRGLGALVAEPAPGDSLAWEVAAPRAVERLALARLLLGRGDAARAAAVAQVFDAAAPHIHLLFVPAALALRADAAEALGRRAEAERYRARLERLRVVRRVAGL